MTASTEIDYTPEDAVRFKEDYKGACELVARMHAAAVGEVTGPKRGVAEDVANLRKQMLDGFESAWGLIANATEAWERPEWKEAAERWRDEVWHKVLDDRVDAAIAADALFETIQKGFEGGVRRSPGILRRLWSRIRP